MAPLIIALNRLIIPTLAILWFFLYFLSMVGDRTGRDLPSSMMIVAVVLSAWILWHSVVIWSLVPRAGTLAHEERVEAFTRRVLWSLCGGIVLRVIVRRVVPLLDPNSAGRLLLLLGYVLPIGALLLLAIPLRSGLVWYQDRRRPKLLK